MKDYYTNKKTFTSVDTVEYEPGTLYISRIKTRDSYQGQGGARELMQELIADADNEGVTLALEINPYGPMNFKQLESWYKRLGFKKTAAPFENCYLRKPKEK